MQLLSKQDDVFLHEAKIIKETKENQQLVLKVQCVTLYYITFESPENMNCSHQTPTSGLLQRFEPKINGSKCLFMDQLCANVVHAKV